MAKKIIKTKKVYSKKDYNSDNGMITYIWGPPLWHVLHTISFNYPTDPTQEDKQNYKKFILCLKNVLPCGNCRKNLAKNLKKLPPKIEHFKNRETFSKYIYLLHEIVNKMLNKNSGLSYEDIRERYEHFRARCTKNENIISNETEKHAIGCIEPLYGKKARCLLKIVPQTKQNLLSVASLTINKKCIKTKSKQQN